MDCSVGEYKVPLGKHEVVARFDGGRLSSDGGLVWLREVDAELGVCAGLAAGIAERRDRRKVKQSIEDLVRQRVFGICCGYEDCNDAETLREDPLLKVALGRAPESGRALASQPTLSRLENAVTRSDLVRMARAMVELFVARHRGAAPERIVLDADATDDPTHGQQELEFYHGYYGRHCYLPLLLFASADGGGEELVAVVLRPGNRHAGHWVAALLERVVERLRAAFPETELVFRGDAGMALPKVYDYCEEAGVEYLISLPKNSRLLAMASETIGEAQTAFAETGEKVRRFGEFVYAAETWRQERRVIVKAEVMAQGENPRFVVTNLSPPDPEAIYEFYIDRGEIENRIKELKNDLFSGRTSCHRFLANQFRLLLHGAAFLLMQGLRRLLAGTELARAQAGTLRVKLLKVAAQVRETTRRIWIHLPTCYPYQGAWAHLLARLGPAPP
jgi:hypothetical protein